MSTVRFFFNRLNSIKSYYKLMALIPYVYTISLCIVVFIPALSLKNYYISEKWYPFKLNDPVLHILIRNLITFLYMHTYIHVYMWKDRCITILGLLALNICSYQRNISFVSFLSFHSLEVYFPPLSKTKSILVSFNFYMLMRYIVLNYKMIIFLYLSLYFLNYILHNILFRKYFLFLYIP